MARSEWQTPQYSTAISNYVCEKSAPTLAQPTPNCDFTTVQIILQQPIETDKHFQPHEAKYRPLEEPSTHLEARAAPAIRQCLADPPAKCAVHKSD
jgi:hypothetical protein